MRYDKHSEWVNSYILVTKKAPDSTLPVSDPSEMTNSSAVNSMPENIVSAKKKSEEQMFQPRGLRYA